MALAFIINKTARTSKRYRRISEDVSLIFLFIAAIIPDLDFVFFNFVEHHSITHSVTFWSIIYLPLFLRWRLKVFPYFIATLSHILGDFFMGKPPVFYGIWQGGYGPFYDYASVNLSLDQLMFARSLLDFSAVTLFVIMHLKSYPAQRFFISSRDAFVGVPILGTLIISIFIASSLQDRLFSLGDVHTWHIYIATYSTLVIAHVLVTLLVIREAKMFVKEQEPEAIRK